LNTRTIRLHVAAASHQFPTGQLTQIANVENIKMGPLYLKKKNGSFKLPHEHGSGAGRVVGSKFLARA
jgi:hypothetical protein